MSDAPKLCKDCKHWDAHTRNCLHPQNVEPSLIDGVPRPQNSPMFMRLNDCGKDGKLWEPKP